jgi:hypothetical protein
MYSNSGTRTIAVFNPFQQATGVDGDHQIVAVEDQLRR